MEHEKNDQEFCAEKRNSITEFGNVIRAFDQNSRNEPQNILRKSQLGINRSNFYKNQNKAEGFLYSSTLLLYDNVKSKTLEILPPRRTEISHFQRKSTSINNPLFELRSSVPHLDCTESQKIFNNMRSISSKSFIWKQ